MLTYVGEPLELIEAAPPEALGEACRRRAHGLWGMRGGGVGLWWVYVVDKLRKKNSLVCFRMTWPGKLELIRGANRLNCSPLTSVGLGGKFLDALLQGFLFVGESNISLMVTVMSRPMITGAPLLSTHMYAGNRYKLKSFIIANPGYAPRY